MRIIILSLFVTLMVACSSTPPAPTIVQIPENDIALSEVTASPEKYTGSFVRWGGRIIKAQEVSVQGQSQLQLEVLSYPLGEKGKPEVEVAAGSRFIARLTPPYDANKFYRNRLVTVAGQLQSTQDYTLANGQVLRLPVVVSQNQYTWRDDYHDHYEPWPRVFYHFGVGRGGTHSGFSIFF